MRPSNQIVGSSNMGTGGRRRRGWAKRILQYVGLIPRSVVHVLEIQYLGDSTMPFLDQH